MNPVNLIPMAASPFCLWACLIQKAPYDSFTSHPTNCSHLSIAVSFLSAGKEARKGQERLWEVALGDPAMVKINFETARKHTHTYTCTHISLSRFTGTFWIDSCLSLSTRV